MVNFVEEIELWTNQMDVVGSDGFVIEKPINVKVVLLFLIFEDQEIRKVVHIVGVDDSLIVVTKVL